MLLMGNRSNSLGVIIIIEANHYGLWNTEGYTLIFRTSPQWSSSCESYCWLLNHGHWSPSESTVRMSNYEDVSLAIKSNKMHDFSQVTIQRNQTTDTSMSENQFRIQSKSTPPVGMVVSFLPWPIPLVPYSYSSTKWKPNPCPILCSRTNAHWTTHCQGFCHLTKTSTSSQLPPNNNYGNIRMMGTYLRFSDDWGNSEALKHGCDMRDLCNSQSYKGCAHHPNSGRSRGSTESPRHLSRTVILTD